MGVGDTIQHQQQGRLLQAVEHIVQGQVTLAGIHLSHHALVPLTVGKTVQTGHGHGHDPHVMGLGQFEQVPRAAVLAVFRQIDFLHVLGGVTQFGGNGMEAVNQAGIGHGEFLFREGGSLPQALQADDFGVQSAVKKPISTKPCRKRARPSAAPRGSPMARSPRTAASRRLMRISAPPWYSP